jgi:hypothetical protein
MDSSPQRHQRARTARRPRRPRQEGGVQMHTTQAGIDIAKAVFEVALSDTPGTVGERHRLSRARFRRFFAGREATTGHHRAARRPAPCSGRSARRDRRASGQGRASPFPTRASGQDDTRGRLAHDAHPRRSIRAPGRLHDRGADDLRTWALAIKQRRGFNVAAVALANKLARVCWRVWHDQRPFQRREAA